MLKEIIVFVYASVVFITLLYLYYEWRERKGKEPNAQLKKNLKALNDKQ